MVKKEMIEELTDIQRLVLTLLGSDKFKPILNHLRLQKILTYFLLLLGKDDNEKKDLLDYAGFYPHKKGPYSEVIEEEVEQLSLQGLLEFTPTSYRAENVRLTKNGKEIFNRLITHLAPKHLEILGEVKEYLNDPEITDEEVLAIIYLDLLNKSKLGKEYTSKSQLLAFIENNRLRYATSLYRKGKISIGKAAELAGISLTEFKEHLR